MKFGVFQHGWWNGACEALKHEVLPLPVVANPTGNTHAADLAGRMSNGAAVVAALGGQEVELLLDNGGTGLGFVRKQDGADDLQIAHEAAGKLLCSHFIDPVTTTFQGLDWNVTWQCLQSRSWLKCVWDRAQVSELQRFGVPGVVQLPMATPDREYDTRPLDPSALRDVVSFVGGQNTSYYTANTNVATSALFPSTLAQAVRGDLPGTPFFDIYYGLYGLAEQPLDTDDVQKRAAKALAYFNAKLHYNAGLCVRNRDRWVIFLGRHLHDRFHLVGQGWDNAYGMSCAPRFDSVEGYLNHFREAAINLNLVNGNAETGLNMRHFEITAAGGFMLCYDQPELGEFFEVGKECVVFSDEKDLLEKIGHYLAHPEERIAIALAGQRRTLSSHLYSHRLEALLRIARSLSDRVDFSSANIWDDFRSLVSKADVVLDCGANVGQMARGFRKAYPEAEIYCFEPVSSVFEELCETCEKVGAHPVKRAVGDRDGSTEINLTASSEANSLLGFETGNPCAKWTRVVGKEQIEVCTLDRWCADNDVDPTRVDIVKLDVQGAEMQALEGASKVLESAKLVHLEVSFVPIYKDCPLFGDIDAFMVKRGYRRHAVYPSDQPQNWGDALYVKK